MQPALLPASVLAAVDGSPESLAAAHWAAAEAEARGVSLRLAHAWPLPQRAAPGLPGVSEARGRAIGLLAGTEAALLVIGSCGHRPGRPYGAAKASVTAGFRCAPEVSPSV
ncbi:universal stress protein [Kitasatospora sp. NPDC127111]|uniref:universal stress protein n=1 Tax=Kitasatospora sp. NPDC127111 TaxID=3345363 RepID=UPI00362886B9